jgi:hypothetical protein
MNHNKLFMNDIQKVLLDSLIKTLTQQGYNAKMSQNPYMDATAIDCLDVRNGPEQATIYVTQYIIIFGPVGGPERVDYHDTDYERLTTEIITKILGMPKQ